MLSFTYNSINSKKVNAYIKTSNHLNMFERDLEFIRVPGRTGDLIVDNKCFKNKNIDISFMIFIENRTKLNELLEKWFYSNYNYSSLKFSDGTLIDAVLKKIDIVKDKSKITFDNIADSEVKEIYNVSVSFNCRKVV